jgi:DmsE family decaheme c-type cytochrome
MKLIRRLLALCAFLGALGMAGNAMATQDLVLNNDAKCTTCHDEGDSPQVLKIGQTKHGTLADGRVGTCTSCHGQSDKHIADADKGLKNPAQPDVDFTKHSKTPMEKRTEVCLACHQGDQRIHWNSGPHASNEVTCTSCHEIHTAHDPVLDKKTQPEVCFTCHKTQRAELRRPSRHPILEGKVSCSDCHNPHGTAGPFLLVRDDVNDTCYTCHAEKRGPFLRPHEPVTEDCTICHNPHGTTAPNLLKERAPFLCQSCHEPTRHPGTYPDGKPIIAGINPTTAQSVIFARGCNNCHTNIHGSNSPATSGASTFRH